MKLLDRHITIELLGPLIFGVAIFTSLTLAGRELFQITELIAEHHAPVLKVLRMFVLRLPSLIVLTFPMSMLLAALLGFGRLSGDSEIVALFSSGISLYRVAVPVMIMAIVVAAISITLGEVIAPRTNSASERLRRELMKEQLTSDRPFFVSDIQDGMTNSVIWVQGGYDAAKGTLRRVAVIRYVNNKPTAFVYANDAVWKQGNEWRFSEGYSQNLGDQQSVIVPFRTFTAKVIQLNKTPEQIALYQKSSDQLSFAQLRDYVAMLEQAGADVRVYKVDLYNKIAFPLVSLVFALIGTPLGLRPHRSSSAMGLGLAIVIIFAYWVLMHYMTILGNSGQISAPAAAFVPTLVGSCVGLALIARAAK